MQGRADGRKRKHSNSDTPRLPNPKPSKSDTPRHHYLRPTSKSDTPRHHYLRRTSKSDTPRHHYPIRLRHHYLTVPHWNPNSPQPIHPRTNTPTREPLQQVAASCSKLQQVAASCMYSFAPTNRPPTPQHDPKPRTLNPKPRTRTRTRNPKPETSNPKPRRETPTRVLVPAAGAVAASCGHRAKGTRLLRRNRWC